MATPITRHLHLKLGICNSAVLPAAYRYHHLWPPYAETVGRHLFLNNSRHCKLLLLRYHTRSASSPLLAAVPSRRATAPKSAAYLRFSVFTSSLRHLSWRCAASTRRAAAKQSLCGRAWRRPLRRPGRNRVVAADGANHRGGLSHQEGRWWRRWRGYQISLIGMPSSLAIAR